MMLLLIMMPLSNLSKLFSPKKFENYCSVSEILEGDY